MKDIQRNIKTWHAIGREATRLVNALRKAMLDFCKKKTLTVIVRALLYYIKFKSSSTTSFATANLYSKRVGCGESSMKNGIVFSFRLNANHT